MSPIRALFFDLDDTLHDFKDASTRAMALVYAQIIARYDIDQASLEKAYGELLRRAEENAFFDGRLSSDYRLERFENLLKTFGIFDDPLVRELAQLYGVELESKMHVFPGVEEALDRFSQKYDLFLVTEGPSDAQRRAIDLLGINRYFKQIFISGELKKVKSSGELFRHALEVSNYQAHEALIVGDSYQRDVTSGLKAGLKTIWLNRRDAKVAEDQPTPSREIKNLNELEDELKKLAPILILGHPRSGTNFVSAVLRSHPSVNLLVEPFSQHSRFFSEHEFAPWNSREFDPAIFHPALAGSPVMADFLDAFRTWLYFDTGEVRAFKETTFFLQLEWLKEYLPGLRIVYIERDPCGVVSSFKKSDFFNRWNYSERFQVLVSQVNADQNLEEYRQMAAEASSGSWADQLTVMWYVRTRKARKALHYFDHVVFKYEDLVAEPEVQFVRMFQFVGLEMNDDVTRALSERTKENRGGEFSTFRDSTKVVDEWTDNLTVNEKRIVRKYTASSEDIKHGKGRRIIK